MLIHCKSGLFIFLFIYLISFSQDIFAQNVEDLKSKIYSKLKCCPCTVSFDKCSCPEAKEMKAYIDALLESGMSEQEIFYKVARKFSLNTILDAQMKTVVEERLVKEVGEKRPQINLDSTFFNFGKISKKQGKINKTFKLSNKGNLPLIIKSLKTSCPCAIVSLKVNNTKSPYFGTKGSPKDWQSEIKPQETAELELMVNLASPHVKTGRLIRDATIISNDPIYPEVTVRIEANVVD